MRIIIYNCNFSFSMNTSEKRVVIFTPLFSRLPKEGYGAIEKITLERATILKKFGFKVQMVGPIDDINIADEIVNIRKIYNFPSTNFLKYYWFVSLKWTKYIHQYIKVAPHVWDAPILSDSVCMDPFNNFFLAKNFGIGKMLFFLHGNNYLTNGKGGLFFKPFDRITSASKKTYYGVLNKRLNKLMLDMGYKSRYMPNGVLFPEKSAVVSDPENYFTFIGGINENKSPHLAIKIAKLLNLNLKLIGPIQDTNYFKEYIRPYLNDNISYLGELNRSQMNNILRWSKGLFFTSIWNEPQGLVILEAISYGIPVIATHSGYYSGTYDMVENFKNGFIGNVDEIIKNFKEITSLNRKNIFTQGRIKWSWDNITRTYHLPVIKEISESNAGWV